MRFSRPAYCRRRRLPSIPCNESDKDGIGSAMSWAASVFWRTPHPAQDCLFSNSNVPPTNTGTILKPARLTLSNCKVKTYDRRTGGSTVAYARLNGYSSPICSKATAQPPDHLCGGRYRPGRAGDHGTVKAQTRCSQRGTLNGLDRFSETRAHAPSSARVRHTGSGRYPLDPGRHRRKGRQNPRFTRYRREG